MSLPKLGDNNENDKKKEIGLPSIPQLPSNFGGSDDFEEVDIEELDIEDEEEFYEDLDDFEEEPNETRLPSNYESEEDEFEYYNDYNPDYEEDLENEDNNEFVNKKKKKIIPFGGDKSKRNVKSLEMDDRKNTLAKTKIIRFGVLIVIVLLFFMGLANTFFPRHVYDEDQIREIAKQSTGNTDFPTKRGEAFVNDFMTLYLSIDKNKPELRQMLSYYYGESEFADLTPDKLNMKIGVDTTQYIITGPTVFDIEPLTDYSALYKVSAYVSNTDGTSVVGSSTNGRWLSFAINVYYDKTLDALAITKDSPSIIPTPNIAKQIDVPERMPFGNGTINSEIGRTLNPTINGFVEAYAKASVSSHEPILQYISDKSDINLYNGFGGTVELNGTPDNAIKKVIYNGDDGIYRVDLTIDWIDKVATTGTNQVEYTAKYVMRVVKEGEGKYSVSSFVPYTYWKAN